MPSVFTFAEDHLGEGMPRVLDRIQGTGADAVTIAASYHQARDVFPHNPAGAIQYLPSGSNAFRSAPARYGLLRPEVPGERGELLSTLVDSASARGLSAQAWAVVLHNSRLGHSNPDVTIRNALGDHLLHALCPAHPEVRQYATALTSDLAAHGVAALHLEALAVGGYDHGETHERALIFLGSTARFLLGLCFCGYCRAAGEAANVDVDVLAERVRHVLAGVLRSHDYAAALPESSPDALQELLGEPITAYLAARTRTVTSLVADVAHAVHAVSARARVVLLDAAGAALGYATGRPETAERATSLGWREGLDLSALWEHVEIGALGYFADPDRMVQEVSSYAAMRKPGSRLEVVMRPTWPDVTSQQKLEANIDAAIRGGADDLHFYTYGLVRSESLDWLARVLPTCADSSVGAPTRAGAPTPGEAPSAGSPPARSEGGAL